MTTRTRHIVTAFTVGTAILSFAIGNVAGGLAMTVVSVMLILNLEP